MLNIRRKLKNPILAGILIALSSACASGARSPESNIRPIWGCGFKSDIWGLGRAEINRLKVTDKLVVLGTWEEFVNGVADSTAADTIQLKAQASYYEGTATIHLFGTVGEKSTDNRFYLQRLYPMCRFEEVVVDSDGEDVILVFRLKGNRGRRPPSNW